MIYPKEFFDLQRDFAARAAALAGLAVPQALLEYTTFYARFGLGRDFAATQPIWREYIEGVSRAPASSEWTYRFYRSRLPDKGPSDIVASVGCFSLARLDDTRLRLHFHNAEASGGSPLAAGRQALRRAELAKLFEHVRSSAGADVRIVGASWLYNLEAYRRLFPLRYLATMTTVAPRFRGMPLWGQLLDRHGELRRDPAEAMLRRLPTLASTRELASCFRYPVWTLEAPMACFLPREAPGTRFAMAVGFPWTAFHGHGEDDVMQKTPVVAAPGRRPGASAADDVAAPTQKALRILLADDNVDLSESFAMLLRELGHRVDVVEDGEAAVRVATEAPPDIAFLDIGMPKLNGFEVAKHFRAEPKTRGVWLVAITGWGQASYRQASKEAGFDRHLVKPVDPTEVLKLIDELSETDAAATRA